MCYAVVLEDSPSLSLQLFDPLLLQLGSLQVPLLQQPVSEAQIYSLCKHRRTFILKNHSCLCVVPLLGDCIIDKEQKARCCVIFLY